MKRNLLNKEWETYIQDYKNSGLSNDFWCWKQNLTVHRLYYWLKKLSSEMEEQNPSVRVGSALFDVYLNWR